MKQMEGNYSASNVFLKRGVEIDFDSNCFRVTNKLFSLIPLPSKCEKIPKPDYVLIFKTLYAKCEACELEDFDMGNGSVYQLSLVYNKNRRLIVDESKNKNEIFSKAKLLAEHFHLKIKDSASNRKQPVWL
jgi:hypothetical protein